MRAMGPGRAKMSAEVATGAWPPVFVPAERKWSGIGRLVALVAPLVIKRLPVWADFGVQIPTHPAMASSSALTPIIEMTRFML